MSYLSSSANALKYLGEKSFTGQQILQASIMIVFGALLIYGGVIIIHDEDIFKMVYEGYQDAKPIAPSVDSSQLVILQSNLPSDLALTALAKNVGNLRNKSTMNSYFGWGMVATGSLVVIYQLYNLIA